MSETESSLEQARRLRRRGRVDEAIRILESYLDAEPDDHAAQMFYLETVRTLRRDVEMVDLAFAGLDMPRHAHRGFDCLDKDVIGFVQGPAAYDRVRARLRGRFAQIVDILQADDARARGDLRAARRHLAQSNPATLPVPWLYVHAQLVLAEGGDPRVAVRDLAHAFALMPKCGAFLRALADALMRLGNPDAAVRCLAESWNRADHSWPDNHVRSPLPLTVVRLVSRVVLAGRFNIDRFLAYTIFLGFVLEGIRHAVRKGRALVRQILNLQRMRSAVLYSLYLVAVVGIGTELFLQVLVPRSDRYFIFPPHITFLHQANPEFTPGVFTDARFRASSLGIRADEFPGHADEVILLFGGSTGLDQLLDQDKAWAAVLQRRLNEAGVSTWVGNLSRSSRASRHNVDYFDHIVPYMPRATVFVNLAGVNDFQLALRSSFGDYTPAQELSFNFSVLPDQSLAGWFGTYRFYRKMKDWRDRQTYAFISNTVGVKQWRDCRQSVPDSGLIDALPDLSAGLDETRRNLHALVDRAEKYGAPMVFVTQPILWRADIGEAERRLLLAGGVGSNGEWCTRKQYYSVRALAEGLEAFNNVTRDVCRERELFCIDLARLLPAKAEYYYDEMHFNEAGAEEVGEIVAEVLRQWRRERSSSVRRISRSPIAGAR